MIYVFDIFIIGASDGMVFTFVNYICKQGAVVCNSQL